MGIFNSVNLANIGKRLKTIWKIAKIPLWFIGFQQGLAKRLTTLFVYTTLGAMVLVVTLIPMFLWTKAICVFSFALLLSCFTVVRYTVSVSEKDAVESQKKQLMEENKKLERQLDEKQITINELADDVQKRENEKDILKKQIKELDGDVQKIENEKDFLKKQINKLEEEKRNQKTELLTMNWIWEINIAEAELNDTKSFDYFINGKKTMLWEERPDDVNSLNGGHRAIGVSKINYKAKIGFDIRETLVKVDKETKSIEYSLPELKITGTGDMKRKWIIKEEMEYKTFQQNSGLMDMLPFVGSTPTKEYYWVIKQLNDNEQQHPIWEKTATDDLEETSARKELEAALGRILKEGYEEKFKNIFKTMLFGKDYTLKSVDRELIKSSAVRFGHKLPELLNEE